MTLRHAGNETMPKHADVFFHVNANSAKFFWENREKESPQRLDFVAMTRPTLKIRQAMLYLQTPASLPEGISHFLEAHTTSRLQGSPAGCGGLHWGGVKARIQTLPSLQSASFLHSSAAKEATGRDNEAITAIGNKNFFNIVRPFLMVRDGNNLVWFKKNQVRRESRAISLMARSL